MIAHHSQASDVQMLYAQNSCSNLASSGAWLFANLVSKGPDLLQVQEDDQSSLPMPLVASWDTVPVTCCVPLHVLHSLESLGNRVSHTQEAIKARQSFDYEFCIWSSVAEYSGARSELSGLSISTDKKNARDTKSQGGGKGHLLPQSSSFVTAKRGVGGKNNPLLPLLGMLESPAQGVLDRTQIRSILARASRIAQGLSELGLCTKQ